MKKWIFKNMLYILTAVAIIVAIYLGIRWTSLSVLEKMVGFFCMAVTLHEWEEFKFPGGFAEMTTKNLGFELKDPGMAKGIIVLLIIYISVIPLFFNNIIWLSLAPITLGFVEIFAHIMAIKMFKLKKLYSPGLITATICMLPISIYSIYYMATNNMLYLRYWIFAIIYMLIGVAFSQALVVRMNGMKYSDFLKNVKSKLG